MKLRLKFDEGVFYLFFVLCTFAFLFPAFPELLGSVGAMIINTGIMLIAILIILIALRRKRFYFFQYKLCLFLICLLSYIFVSLPFSITLGYFFSGVTISVRDFFEFNKPVLYIVSFCSALIVFDSAHALPKYEKLLMFLFIVIIIMAFHQFFKVSPAFSELYTKFNNIKSQRVAVPFVNPYDFSFVMSFFFFFFLCKTFFLNKAYILLSLLTLVLIFLTQSRSGAIALVVTMFFIFSPLVAYKSGSIKSMRYTRNFFFYIVFLLTAVVIFILLLDYIQENFRYMSVAFEQLLEGKRINSASIRKEQMIFAIDKAHNPLVFLFGNGPAKEQMPYVETIYTYLFYRYGFFGLCTYFLYLFTITILNLKLVLKLNRRDPRFCLFAAYLIWFLAIPIFSIGNNLTEQLRSSFFYYMSSGIIVISYLNICFEQKHESCLCIDAVPSRK
jgi:hypothetical protein